MTRGTPCVKIGVIHPVESYWLFWGPRSQTGARADDTESRFYKITDMLLQNQLDFDYINESLLVSLYKETEKDFRVGHMSYSAVVVPQCVTMRSTTLDALLCFARHGGKIIIAGKAPEYIDGVKSARGEELASVSECVNFSAGEITSALDEFRTVDIRNGSGSRPGNIIYRMRNDGKDKYIFIAHFNKPYSMDAQQKEKYTVSFRGKQRISIMDTQNGEITEVQPLFDGKNTVLEWQCFACDSLLLRVTEDMRNEKTEEYVKTESTENKEVKRERLACESHYALDEPNVLLLDMPRYSLDGKEFSDNTFILEVGERAKAYFGIKKSGLQPWLRPVCREKTGSLRLRYIINSEKEIKGAHLAGESFEYTELYLNGEKITSPCDGYFVDEAIKTVTLPVIRKGENELTADIAFCEDAKTEAYYLLGDFGVRLCGVNAVLTELPEKLAFSDVHIRGFSLLREYRITA